MAGLGLTNALQSYQQGVQWRQQQDLIAEQKAKKDRLNAANKAGSEVMTQAQAQHEAEQAAALEGWTKEKGTNEGFQATPFKMNESLMLNALDARSAVLAKGGDWDDWMGNEAKAAPLREQVRTKTFDAALKQYDMDGDPIALAETVYPTIYDGKKIVRPIIDKTGGKGFKAASGLANAGAAMPMERISFELSDGSKTKPLTKDQLVAKVKWASMNPAEVRQYEMQERLNAAKLALTKAEKDAEAEKEINVEGVKHKNKMGLSEFEQDRLDARSAADNASAKERTNTTASATRYSADQSREAAKLRADGKPGDDVKDGEQLLDTLAKAGIGEVDPLTKQTRPTALTQRAAQRVNQLKGTGMNFDKAVETVRAEIDAARANGTLK